MRTPSCSVTSSGHGPPGSALAPASPFGSDDSSSGSAASRALSISTVEAACGSGSLDSFSRRPETRLGDRRVRGVFPPMRASGGVDSGELAGEGVRRGGEGNFGFSTDEYLCPMGSKECQPCGGRSSGRPARKEPYAS